ncbi:hypothetical protein [Salidesulfovibrio brasiliensis]|uniref:hypothetical protein n=1 Tax=Salidesulfovibrio brasiliensis TaxID=221711 RepID=UPI0006CF2852|nr:hypothetical protein [Salidesulfovibrio brasiliensis]
MLIKNRKAPQPFQGFPSPERYEWFRAEDEEGLFAWVALAESGEDMELHLEAVRWGPQARRSMTSDLEWVKAEARRRGKRRLIGLKAEAGQHPDPRWAKFVGLFGFGNIGVVQTATLEL